MLWLHETHHLAGRLEDEFEHIAREEWLPALGAVDGAKLLYFLKHAHGTGASYRVVTVTALRDAAAYGELIAAVDGGPLAKLAEALDRTRHDVFGKLLVPLPWARDAQPAFDSIPESAQAHDPALFMEDTVWPHEEVLERYVEQSGAHYAKEMRQRREERRAILRVEGAYRTAHGSGQRREIVLWQRVEQTAALEALITREVPEEFKQPGSWMHDALELRDRWESRLLRRAAWSPLA